ncbi:MAG: AB hydrolase superfamily protein YdjP [Anaerolineae bacterium]|nr:AB hydrolase superfamily protein YdjP [Anaerolineae bacterium]
MSAVVIDGGLVHYEAFGRGKPVLFLHGWLGSWRYWMATMETISDKYRTYALDLWGFGDSDKSKPRYQISDYVALINNFTENMGIRDAPIVGHALGATVALEYTARYPDRVQKVMAVSLPLTPDSISRRLIESGSGSVFSKMLRWRQTAPKEVEKEAEKTGDGVVSASVQSASQIDVYSRLEMIGQSNSLMLAVYGEKDDMVDPTPARELNGSWPNIRPIGLSESRHFPMLEEAARFNRLLQDFLDTQDDLSVLELKDEWRRRTR